MNISPSLIAHLQAPKPIQPRERSLHHPAMPAQALAGVNALSSNSRDDVPVTQGLTMTGRVICLISMQLVRTLARSATSLWKGRYSIHHHQEHLRVMDICTRVSYRQGDTTSVYHKMALRTRFASIRRIWAGLLSPPGAGTLAESIDARDQSSCSASESRFSKAWCSRSHTPASCQSLSRRQQLMPLPQPISWGNISQGMPVFSTKRMPVRAARSGMRGRPPLGLAGSFGSNGSMISQSSSGTSCLDIPKAYTISEVLLGGLNIPGGTR